MRVLVSDASILIELGKWYLLEAFFRLPFDIAIPDALFEDELIDLGVVDRERLKMLGLRVESLDAKGVERAVIYQTSRPKLTIHDCLAVTLAATNGWMLLTGDKRMCRLAVEEDVEAHGVLWVINRLVEYQAAPVDTIVEALRGMLEDPRTHLPRIEIDNLLSSLTNSS
jgi:hypothetical protein